MRNAIGFWLFAIAITAITAAIVINDYVRFAR